MSTQNAKRLKPITSLTIGRKTLERAKQLCQEREQSLSSLVNQLLREYIEKKDGDYREHTREPLLLAEDRAPYGKKKKNKR